MPERREAMGNNFIELRCNGIPVVLNTSTIFRVVEEVMGTRAICRIVFLNRELYSLYPDESFAEVKRLLMGKGGEQ